MALKQDDTPAQVVKVSLTASGATASWSGSNGADKVVISQSNDQAGAVAIAVGYNSSAAKVPDASASGSNYEVFGFVNGTALVREAQQGSKITSVALDTDAGSAKTIWVNFYA
jgi:hypothetical protein